MVVQIEQDSITVPVGSLHRSHRPANANRESSCIPKWKGCFSFPLRRHSKKPSAGSKHWRLMKASRNAGLLATVSARALIVLNPTLASLAQDGMRPHLPPFTPRGSVSVQLSCSSPSLLLPPYVVCFWSFRGKLMRDLVLAAVLLCAVPLASTAQSTRHPFTFDDAKIIHSVRAVAVSPDGKSVLYQVTFGGSKGPDNTEWELIPATGGEARYLTIPEKFQPAGFTRDGSVFGTYEVNKMAQLATLALPPANTPAAAAATPVPLTALPRGVHSANISPDGTHYAVLADPRLPDPLTDVHTVVEAEPISLYVIGADGSGGAWWCSTLRDVGSIAWSRDGASVAVLSQTPKIGFHYVRSFIDVCSVTGARHGAGEICGETGHFPFSMPPRLNDLLTVRSCRNRQTRGSHSLCGFHEKLDCCSDDGHRTSDIEENGTKHPLSPEWFIWEGEEK